MQFIVVTANAFVLWYLPDTKPDDCILAWRPEQTGNMYARPLSDYAHVGDVLALGCVNRV